MKNSSMTNLVYMEKWWTKKSSPDDIRGSFNAELLRRIIEIKMERISASVK
jgi:hypothetical protein